jgi:hypothetical protein
LQAVTNCVTMITRIKTDKSDKVCVTMIKRIKTDKSDKVENDGGLLSVFIVLITVTLFSRDPAHLLARRFCGDLFRVRFLRAAGIGLR